MVLTNKVPLGQEALGQLLDRKSAVEPVFILDKLGVPHAVFFTFQLNLCGIWDQIGYDLYKDDLKVSTIDSETEKTIRHLLNLEIEYFSNEDKDLEMLGAWAIMRLSEKYKGYYSSLNLGYL